MKQILLCGQIFYKMVYFDVYTATLAGQNVIFVKIYFMAKFNICWFVQNLVPSFEKSDRGAGESLQTNHESVNLQKSIKQVAYAKKCESQ